MARVSIIGTTVTFLGFGNKKAFERFMAYPKVDIDARKKEADKIIPKFFEIESEETKEC